MNEKKERRIRETIYVREGMLHLSPSFAIRVEYKVFIENSGNILRR